MPTELLPIDPNEDAPRLTHYPMVLVFKHPTEATWKRIVFATPNMLPEHIERNPELKRYAEKLSNEGWILSCDEPGGSMRPGIHTIKYA